MFTASDHAFMARAMRLAEHGLYTTDPNPRVGCVLVRDGEVVGQGWHRQAGGAHAEVMALEDAGERARGATAYVTLEPCCHHGRTSPCTEALIHAGIRQVILAMQDPNPQVAGRGMKQLASAGIEVRSGLLTSQAQALNPGFIRRMSQKRPYVRSKLAMSMDGRTALANGVSQWLTGSAARRDVQHWRARSSAIVTGIGTVLMDDPSLSVRPEQAGWTETPPGFRQPDRVIVDSTGRLPATARLLSQPGRTIVATLAAGAEKLTRSMADSRVSCHALADKNGRVDLQALAALLAELEINEVLVEAGQTLNGALLRAGLIDELIIYLAPRLLGHTAQGLFDLPALTDLADCVELQIRDIRAVGQDWRITAMVSADANAPPET